MGLGVEFYRRLGAAGRGGTGPWGQCQDSKLRPLGWCPCPLRGASCLGDSELMSSSAKAGAPQHPALGFQHCSSFLSNFWGSCSSPTPVSISSDFPALHSGGGPYTPSCWDLTGSLNSTRTSWTAAGLSKGNPGLPLSLQNPEAGGEGAGRREVGKASSARSLRPPAHPPCLPPLCLPPSSASQPASRPALGVCASNKLLSQTWTKEPEAAQKPAVHELQFKAAGHWVSDGRACASSSRAEGVGVRAWNSSLFSSLPGHTSLAALLSLSDPCQPLLGSPHPIPSCDRRQGCPLRYPACAHRSLDMHPLSSARLQRGRPPNPPPRPPPPWHGPITLDLSLPASRDPDWRTGPEPIND